MNKVKNGEFYTAPKKMNLSEVFKPYQEAFGGYPWYEVSACIDQEVPRRCSGGFSSVAIGEICMRCDLKLLEPAYDPEELIARFEELSDTRPTSWYTERVDGEVAMVAVAWKADSPIVSGEKYPDVPEMASWLMEQLGDASSSFIWLDEVFADKSVRSIGNLKNFGAMCRAFSSELKSPRLVFRTINEAMIRAATRDFGDEAVIFRGKRSQPELVDLCVPDQRDLVIIDIQGSEL